MGTSGSKTPNSKEEKIVIEAGKTAKTAKKIAEKESLNKGKAKVANMRGFFACIINVMITYLGVTLLYAESFATLDMPLLPEINK